MPRVVALPAQCQFGTRGEHVGRARRAKKNIWLRGRPDIEPRSDDCPRESGPISTPSDDRPRDARLADDVLEALRLRDELDAVCLRSRVFVE